MKKTLRFSSLLFVVVLAVLDGCSPKVTAVITAPTATGNAESLTRETNDPSNEFYPRISADGRYMFYNVVETSIGFGGSMFNPTVRTNKKSKIVRKQLGNPTTNPLKDNAADGTTMPNGNILFTYVLPNKPVIAYTSSEGVGINYVSQGEMGDDDAQPIINRSGSKIIFTTLIGGRRMICSMDARGGNFTVITEGYKPIFFPNNEGKIVYNLRVNGRDQIFTLDLQSGQKSQITSGDYNNKDAAYTRDGQYVAFVSNRENPKLAKHHLYVMRADGTGIIQITQGTTDEADPAWGPDGMLYFACSLGKDYSIWKAKPRLTANLTTK